VADKRHVAASELSEADIRELQQAWQLFVAKDPRWPTARDRWLERGGAAPYMLSENLFRYFWSASRYNKRAEITRVAYEAKVVGEPAVAYFTKPLVTDRWPLKEPMTVKVPNPDNLKRPITKTFTHYDIDDMTRQHAAQVLAAIGAPAIPTLTSPAVMNSPIDSAPTYAAYALGAIASDAAVQALGRMVRSGRTWRDRGAAAKGLGFALRTNPNARPHLEAARNDPDKFVRKKAEEGLQGKTKIEF
jgi:hypothetical protein